MHDISVEGFIESFDRRYPTFILKTLLCDRTTGRNIIWADNEYEALGDGYMGDDEMTVENAHVRSRSKQPKTIDRPPALHYSEPKTKR